MFVAGRGSALSKGVITLRRSRKEAPNYAGNPTEVEPFSEPKISVCKVYTN